VSVGRFERKDKGGSLGVLRPTDCGEFCFTKLLRDVPPPRPIIMAACFPPASHGKNRDTGEPTRHEACTVWMKVGAFGQTAKWPGGGQIARKLPEMQALDMARKLEPLSI
jgi:hypothetical protein